MKRRMMTRVWPHCYGVTRAKGTDNGNGNGNGVSDAETPGLQNGDYVEEQHTTTVSADVLFASNK